MHSRTDNNLSPAQPPKASLRFTLGVLSTVTLLAAPATNAETPESGSTIELAPYSAPLVAPVIKTEDEPIGIESTTVNSCFNSGSGAYSMRVCVTTHGNVSIESPIGNSLVSGFHHEGYTVCDSAGLGGYDSKLSESGFGTATIKQPNGANTFPLTIIRSSANWKLTQTFAHDAVEHDFTVTMALKNISGATRTNAFIFRYFDADINQSSTNIFDRSDNSAYARDDNLNVLGHALSLTALSNASHHARISAYSHASTDFLVGMCSVYVENGPTPPGDYVGFVAYYWPSVAANATKTVKFTYRVF